MGAPPTLRRISMYSIGLGTRFWLILESSHRDSLSRFWVLSENRSRQSADVVGAVRDHRSARPRSTGLVDSGSMPMGATGMKAGSLERYSSAPARSRLRLYFSRK
jgi:hypothetical protein